MYLPIWLTDPPRIIWLVVTHLQKVMEGDILKRQLQCALTQLGEGGGGRAAFPQGI